MRAPGDHSWRTYGPLVIASPLLCTGEKEAFVSAARKYGVGALSVMRTTSAPIASTPSASTRRFVPLLIAAPFWMGAARNALGDLVRGSTRRRKLWTKSLAVRRSPFDQRRPGRS